MMKENESAQKIKLGLVLTDDEPERIAAAVSQVGLVPREVPSSIEVDDEVKSAEVNWLAVWAHEFRHSLRVEWGDFRNQLVLFKNRAVVLNRSDFPLRLRDFLEGLANLPFTIASMSTIHLEWMDGSLGKEYYAPSFGELHAPHGWACAFKGQGHAQLVSRRWLEHGPWRVLYGPNDTTLVQFHSLNADPEVALLQARPGHERMGIRDTGGYLQNDYIYRYDLKGFYDPSRRVLKIVVHGRKVNEHEMLDACAARHYQALDNDQPLENVAYVFLEENVAHQHLHQLWLREIECWTIRDGHEVRLDTDYNPDVRKPEWVKRE